MKIKENDLGDRMMLGLPATTPGSVTPGLGTFSSPDVSQNPTSFFPDGTNKSSDQPDKSNQITKSDVEQLKSKVTPDEILCGIEYELKRMVNANKEQAKIIVVKNLKSDPKYYSSLNMMIKGDERIDESLEEKESEKKKAFQEIFSGISDKQKRLSERNVDPRILDAFKETVEKRKQRFGR